MGGRGIPYLIDGLHGRIYSRIEAYGIIRACDVQIDGPGKANRIDPVAGQRLRALVRAVAADNHKSVNAVLAADVGSLLLSGRQR